MKSIISPTRLDSLTDTLIRARNIPGCVIEFGVFMGGSLCRIALHEKTKKIYGIDTFTGLPEKSDKDPFHEIGDFNSGAFESIKSEFAGFGNVEILKGIFPEGFPNFEPGVISFAHVDVDMYKSTKDCFNFVHRRIMTSGYIICDDYGADTTPGARIAVNEFVGENPKHYKIVNVTECQITLQRIK